MIEQTVPGIIGSAFGAAGQRCMAGSVVVTRGGVNISKSKVTGLDSSNRSPGAQAAAASRARAGVTVVTG